MGKPTGFMEFDREGAPRRPVEQRVNDWGEIYERLPNEALRRQGARCMDCGVPFCMQGCPLGNIIPDWNDLVYRDQWKQAIDRLHATNNLPEVTGTLCPAPCESSCVLQINDDPVTIKQIERAIAERAFDEGWVVPRPPTTLTGKRVAIIGSGPAGLACAQQLRRAGHEVTVFERDPRPGGLLIYGIPEFKMEKKNIFRRVEQITAEGVVFRTSCEVGRDIGVDELRAEHDAVVVCIGATSPRDLTIPGRELSGIHFAMDYLVPANKRLLGDELAEGEYIDAADKHVIIVGGGDTGADCFGTALRQGCRDVVQFQIHDRPPSTRDEQANPWPQWDNIYRVSGAHEEGGAREFAVRTKRFTSDGHGNVAELHTVRVEELPERAPNGRAQYREVDGSERVYPADLVLLAIGYQGPGAHGLTDTLGVERGNRGNVITDDDCMTSQPGIFAAGDAARGQSLIVWAIAEGRQAAHGVDKYLMGATELPAPLAGDQRAVPFH